MRRIMMAAAMLLAVGAHAGHAAALKADRAGSCVLTGGVAAAIKVALVFANGQQALGLDVKSLSVDSITIRSAANPNGGQRLANKTDYTGPVVCVFDGGVLPPAAPYSIVSTPANKTISNVTLLASQVDTFLQYALANGKKENLLCLTTKGNNDCFSIYLKGSR